MIPVIKIATTWTKHVANAWGKKERPVKTKVPFDRTLRHHFAKIGEKTHKVGR